MRSAFSTFMTLLVAVLAPVSVCLADGGCEPHELGDGRPFVKRAEAAEKTGNFKGALQELKRMPACASNVNHTQISEWRERLCRRQGEVEEKQGRFESALGWYRDARSEEDIARTMDKWGKSAPRDDRVFHQVFDYFERGHPDAARLKEFRGIAARNADDLLAREDKAFPKMEESREWLQQARQWLRFTEGGEKKANDRAVLRGDTLAKDESPGTFQRALTYYDFARAEDRKTQLRERALKLAEMYEKKGEVVMAGHYYGIAGKNDKAQTLAKQHLVKEQKDEGSRKARFQQDQKALEKELGF
jgi:hypothetical protein